MFLLSTYEYTEVLIGSIMFIMFYVIYIFLCIKFNNSNISNVNNINILFDILYTSSIFIIIFYLQKIVVNYYIIQYQAIL